MFNSLRDSIDTPNSRYGKNTLIGNVCYSPECTLGGAFIPIVDSGLICGNLIKSAIPTVENVDRFSRKLVSLFAETLYCSC